MKILKQASLCFSAGALGALANSITAVAAGRLGITAALHVAIAPHLSAQWLYPRIVWGGLWGLFFLLPFRPTPSYLRGAIFSLAPTFFQLFIVFPYFAHKGMAGLALGTLTPLVVLALNLVWGWCAQFTLSLTR